MSSIEVTVNASSIIKTPFPAVCICNQIWSAQNLNTVHYRNGDLIPQVTNLSVFDTLTTGAWCYYENNSIWGTSFGKLYNWYAVNDIRGLAPNGWHIPSDLEWTTLSDCLGGESVAGGKMKTADTAFWLAPNNDATNSSGFNSLPTGFYDEVNNVFPNLGGIAFYFSTTEFDALYIWSRNVYFSHDQLTRAYWGYRKFMAMGVRCVKD